MEEMQGQEGLSSWMSSERRKTSCEPTDQTTPYALIGRHPWRMIFAKYHPDDL